MKFASIGLGIFMLGFIIVTIGAGIFNSGNPEYSYYYAIVFSILYLCSIVGIAASLILKELRKEKED